jgi:hypothetical protein
VHKVHNTVRPRNNVFCNDLSLLTGHTDTNLLYFVMTELSGSVVRINLDRILPLLWGWRKRLRRNKEISEVRRTRKSAMVNSPVKLLFILLPHGSLGYRNEWQVDRLTVN